MMLVRRREAVWGSGTFPRRYHSVRISVSVLTQLSMQNISDSSTATCW